MAIAEVATELYELEMVLFAYCNVRTRIISSYWVDRQRYWHTIASMSSGDDDDDESVRVHLTTIKLKSTSGKYECLYVSNSFGWMRSHEVNNHYDLFLGSSICIILSHRTFFLYVCTYWLFYISNNQKWNITSCITHFARPVCTSEKKIAFLSTSIYNSLLFLKKKKKRINFTPFVGFQLMWSFILPNF